jgi:hypothetical protein
MTRAPRSEAPEGQALQEIDGRFAQGDYAGTTALLGELHAAQPALRDAIRRRWSHYVNELVEQQSLHASLFVDVRKRLFADDAATAAIAAQALNTCGRWQELLDSRPRDRVLEAEALFALGQTRAVLERFADVPTIKSEALLRLGQFARLKPGDHLYERSLLLRGALAEALRAAPDDPELLLAAGQPATVLEKPDTPPEFVATALRHLGRQEEALGLGDVLSLLYGGHIDRALERATSPELLRVVWSFRALNSFIAGDLGDYGRSREQLSKLPLSWRWRNVWFASQVLLPFLDWLGGEDSAMSHAWRIARSQAVEVCYQSWWYFALLASGEIDATEFREQPMQLLLEARLAVGLAIRSELSGDQSAALQHYRRYLELAAQDRAFEPAYDDPVLDCFVGWRTEQCSRSG